MSSGVTPFRRFARSLFPALGLVLVIGLFAFVSHDHPRESPDHHHCAICSVNHTLAVETEPVVGLSVPPSRSDYLATPPVDTPRSTVASTPQGRAPPSS